jgi:hypothetical protein
MLSLHVSISFFKILWYDVWTMFILNLLVHIYILCRLYELRNYGTLWWWDWLRKLVVVNNLGCPKCKRNSAEFLVKRKKNLPLNKEDVLGTFNNDRSYSQTVTVSIRALVWVLGRNQKRLLMFINLLQDGMYPSRY